MLNPVAYFDCLGICLRLQSRLDEPSSAEISLFSYLSCLLWLYKGKPVSTWGYTFAVTQQASIFSADIQIGIAALADQGFIHSKDQFYLHVTPEGKREYEYIRTLSTMAEREAFLEGACASLLALPYGLIRNALQEEPDIKATIALSQSRELLTDNYIYSLYQQFEVLSSAIGIEINDLMIPAIVWLKYLSEIQST